MNIIPEAKVTAYNKMISNEKFCQLGLNVINTEAQAIKELCSRIDGVFAQACHYLFACQGRIVVTGMGKSGHIGGKIASTLASTGSPAFFVHPGEASHGDLGMITKKDVVLAISNSGETEEILTILPLIKRLAIPLITLTGNPHSTLATIATVNLNVSVTKEACPLNLSPTSSTTATLVMGDAIAIALLEARGFTAEDFAFSHPAGALGKRLLLRVSDLMHTKNNIPRVEETAGLNIALIEMTQKRLGMTTVINNQGKLIGVFTDGDLRRILEKKVDIHNTILKDIATINCKTIHSHMLAAEALTLMETYKITALPIVDNEELVGVIHLHDLLQAGVV